MLEIEICRLSISYNIYNFRKKKQTRKIPVTTSMTSTFSLTNRLERGIKYSRPGGQLGTS